MGGTTQVVTNWGEIHLPCPKLININVRCLVRHLKASLWGLMAVAGRDVAGGVGGQTHFVWKFWVVPKGPCEQKLSWISWPSNIPWGKVWVSEGLFKTREGRGWGDQWFFEQYKKKVILVQVGCPTQPYSRECVDWLFPSTEQRQLADIFDSSSTNLFKYEILFRHKIQTKFLALKVISLTFILIEPCNGLQD